MTIGEHILLRRKSLGLTQGELAKAVKVDETTIRRWEKGRSTPTANQINVLSQVLSTTTAYLLGETDDPSPSAAAPVVSNTGTNNGTMAGRDAVPPTQTVTLDLTGVMQFALQLKDQGNIDKMKDAIDIYKSSIAVLERAVQESVPA